MTWRVLIGAIRSGPVHWLTLAQRSSMCASGAGIFWESSASMVKKEPSVQFMMSFDIRSSCHAMALASVPPDRSRGFPP